MKRCVALAPAYPPLNGDPMIAAPLLITMIRLPGRSGSRSASLSQWNAIRTSVFQFMENDSHVCCCSGRRTGAAPAIRARTAGLCCPSSLAATAGSLASAATSCSRRSRAASSVSGPVSRATATTDAPSARNASVTPLPSPRLAPTTITRLSASWFIPTSLIDNARQTLLTGSVHEAPHGRVARAPRMDASSLFEAVEHRRDEACEDEQRENEPEHSQVGVCLRPTHSPWNRPSEPDGARVSAGRIHVEGDAKGSGDLDRFVVRWVIAPESQHAATIGIEQQKTGLHSRQGEARHEWARHAGDVAPGNDT